MKNGNIVSLSVHKNTRDRRIAKQRRKDLMRAAKDAGQIEGLQGYAVVTWADNGACNIGIYHTETVAPRNVPDLCRSVLDSAVKRSSGEHD